MPIVYERGSVRGAQQEARLRYGDFTLIVQKLLPGKALGYGWGNVVV